MRATSRIAAGLGVLLVLGGLLHFLGVAWTWRHGLPPPRRVAFLGLIGVVQLVGGGLYLVGRRSRPTLLLGALLVGAYAALHLPLLAGASVRLAAALGVHLAGAVSILISLARGAPLEPPGDLSDPGRGSA